MKAKPIKLSAILDAQQHTRSHRAAARYLNADVSTYRKYAKLYGVYTDFKNQPGRGIPRKRYHGRYGLNEIFAGKHPDYSPNELKYRLFAAGLRKEECDLCGWTEKRMHDGKGPFRLDYIDGNPKNYALDNLRILCYNCFHITGGTYNPKESQTARRAYDNDISLAEADIELLVDELHTLSPEELQEIAANATNKTPNPS